MPLIVRASRDRILEIESGMTLNGQNGNDARKGEETILDGVPAAHCNRSRPLRPCLRTTPVTIDETFVRKGLGCLTR